MSEEQRPTLYEMCLQNTARLLKTSYWNTGLSQSQNPFSFLPSSIVNTIITYVTRMSTCEPLLSFDLRLLSTSGRVTQFVIEDPRPRMIILDDENLSKILMDLSASCHALTTIKIDFLYGWEPGHYRDTTSALNDLLGKTQNLVCLVACVNFDLSLLHGHAHLEKLIVTFPPRNPLHDMLKSNGTFSANTYLKCIQISTSPRDSISLEDLAVVLTYCTELVYTDIDITQGFEYLHAEDLHSGSLTCEYKLQKCVLGNFRRCTTRDAVLIATRTCPDLREVKLFVDDGNAISALSDCHNLETLYIWWHQQIYYDDYTLELSFYLLLEKPEIGFRLKTLELYNCTNIDFPSIGRCCPNLEVLKVYYEMENVNFEYSPASIRQLRSLDLLSGYGNVEADILVGLLTNANNLEFLRIWCAGEFTDDLLDNILKSNRLSNLKDICMDYCGLSLTGMRKLACTTKNLRSVVLNRSHFSGEIVALFQEINPRVYVRENSSAPVMFEWFCTNVHFFQ